MTLPFTIGYRLIGEIQRILRRNWNHVAEVPARLQQFQKETEALKTKKEILSASWRPKPPPRESTHTTLPSDSSLWSDRVTGVTMMYLSLLDKKKRARSRPRQPQIM